LLSQGGKVEQVWHRRRHNRRHKGSHLHKVRRLRKLRHRQPRPKGRPLQTPGAVVVAPVAREQRLRKRIAIPTMTRSWWLVSWGVAVVV
jgi:hypothetical protein